MALSLFPSHVPIVDATGRMTPEFVRALSSLIDRVGGPLGDNGVDVFAQADGDVDSGSESAVMDIPAQPVSEEQTLPDVMQPDSGLIVDAAGETQLLSQNVARLRFPIAGGTILTGTLTHGGTVLLITSVALTNGAGGALGTLTTAPFAGDPSKWIPISDNGTTRYIPSW
jgi:hypothetical protein